MELRRYAIAVAVCLSLAGCGGSKSSPTSPVETSSRGASTKATNTKPTQDLADFFAERIRYELKGQYSRSWATLHPGQQKLVPLTAYDDCRRQASSQVAGVELKSLKVQETYEDPIDVPGVPQRKALAVTVKTTYKGAAGAEESTTDTWHTVAINGHWVWMLSPSQVKAFQDGTCPT